MMSYRMTVLDLTVIDLADDTYRISNPAAVEDLAKSIQHVGLINPPILFQKQDRYIILAGFHRIAAMQQMNCRQIPVKVVPPETSSLERIRIAITDNISQRKLDLLETSRALALLAECTGDRDHLVDEAQNLGLPGSYQHIKKIIGICQLPHLIQEGINQNRISLNMATELQDIEGPAGNQLAGLFMGLQFNQNKQREILSHLKEIAHREKGSVQEVLLSESISEVIDDTNLDNLQKTRLVRSKLRKRRFPNLSLAEETFQHHLQKLKLGNKISLTAPAYFEGTSMKLSMSFTNESELREQIDTLNKTLSNPHLSKIFQSC
jgi:ParB family chromosome partitioning protein